MTKHVIALRALTLMTLIVCIGAAFAAERDAAIHFRSGPQRVTLVELYTSEGCSSCPPAEQWLADLARERGLWRDFVPIAFHVNYWDHLGWRDALASQAFTTRQHRYAAAWGAASVYTPGFVRDGSEWRPRALPVPGDPSADAGILTVTWRPSDRTAEVTYRLPAATAGMPTRALDVSVALLGSGLATRVRRGENAGRELRHGFVALHLETVPLRRQPSGEFVGRVGVPRRTDVAPTRQALAAWITGRDELSPLQAVGGWME